MIGAGRGRRAVLTMADQVFSSASNFLVGLAVARLTGPETFGAFALAYAVWLSVAGVHRALVTDPLLIHDSPDDETRRRERIRDALSAEVLLSVAATGLVALAGLVVRALGSASLGAALLALAPWLFFLLVQDAWRWIAFMRGEPGKAIANDGVYIVVQIALLVAFASAGVRSVSGPLTAWGIGGLAGALFGFAQFRVPIRLRGGLGYVRRTWNVSGWLLADFATSYGATQVHLFVVAATLGPVGLGALKAGLNLMGPTHVLLLTAGSFGLPESVRALNQEGVGGLDRVVKTIAGVMTVAVGCIALVVAVGSGRLMGFVYGDGYAGFGALAALAALQYLVAASAAGPDLGLKASARTRSLFAARLITASVSVGSVLVLTSAFGLVGAGWAGVVTAGANASSTWFVYLRARRDLRRSSLPSGERFERVEPRVEVHAVAIHSVPGE